MKLLRPDRVTADGPPWSVSSGFGNIDRMTPAMHSQIVKALATEAGFDRVGITSAEPLTRAAYYRRWLAAGHAGTMAYLHRNSDLRAEPARILPGAKSIVCVALNYRRPPEDARPVEADEESGRVAMYARGVDYHVVLHRRLADFLSRMRERIATPFEARPFVDSVPLIERELAARAGIGWIGKNTLVLSPGLGSLLFLGEIVTTLELVADEPMPDHCGTCTRCLEACPTQAFVAPYQMDASRCISYLTIEHRGEISEDLAAKMGDWVYGCDVCQDVCPHNTRVPLATDADLLARKIPERVPLAEIGQMTTGRYKRFVALSAARRAGRRMWQRNAAIAMRNIKMRICSCGIDPDGSASRE